MLNSKLWIKACMMNQKSICLLEILLITMKMDLQKSKIDWLLNQMKRVWKNLKLQKIKSTEIFRLIKK